MTAPGGRICFTPKPSLGSFINNPSTGVSVGFSKVDTVEFRETMANMVRFDFLLYEKEDGPMAFVARLERLKPAPAPSATRVITEQRCVACLAHKSNIRSRLCGHLCLCNFCAAKLLKRKINGDNEAANCPMCRADSGDFVLDLSATYTKPTKKHATKKRRVTRLDDDDSSHDNDESDDDAVQTAIRRSMNDVAAVGTSTTSSATSSTSTSTASSHAPVSQTDSPVLPPPTIAPPALFTADQ
jgi:hypothetical protein